MPCHAIRNRASSAFTETGLITMCFCKAKKRANPKFSIHDISAFANHPMMDTEDSLGSPLRNVLGSYYGHAVASPADFRAVAVWISDYLKRRPTASNRTLLTRVAREFWRQSGVKSAR